ncbi:MAG: hypothetical protein K5863_09145 [Nitratireductor sp.]|uniref:hypothetical protein n=1 Tax=Nitratireductor sp. TaxID=1872084 RepID=UPI00262583B7|nr:hypothetical protein [Nitratireductor sp.]MCV0350230.1 hypothetical protein [Nitratireductor sp.]
MAFPDYMSAVEKRIIGKMLRKALASNYVVSVFDGMEWPVKRSSDYETITADIGTTDITELLFRDSKTHAKVGWMMLVHGNDEDVICDHTANEEMEACVS